MRESWRNAGEAALEADGGSATGSESLIGSIRRTEAALRTPENMFERHSHSRWFDLIWLVYSAFFFIEPIARKSGRYWLEFAGVYLLFLALYVGIIQIRSRRVVLILLAAMGVLGAAYYPFNGGASGMFIYVAAFAPFITESLALCIGAFVAVSSVVMAEGLLLHMSPWSWGFTVFLAIAVGSANLVVGQRMRANQRLSLAHEEIAHLAKVAERERIARDLHDVLGHTLSVVVLKSELAGKLMDRNPERARKEIAEVEQIARAALGEVRQAIRGYRAEGLTAELEHARVVLDAAGIALNSPSQVPALRAAEETVLSLIVREAVTNIVRHARASQCSVRLSADEGCTSLLIEDDGIGGVRQEGNGLRGMRERVESLGGALQIQSARGTQLKIEIPAQALGNG